LDKEIKDENNNWIHSSSNLRLGMGQMYNLYIKKVRNKNDRYRKRAKQEIVFNDSKANITTDAGNAQLLAEKIIKQVETNDYRKVAP